MLVKMPVEAAFGDLQSSAQLVDLEGLQALFGQDRVPGRAPVVDPQPAAGSGVRQLVDMVPIARHKRQPTAG